jgi:hypothetical protein
MYCLFSCEHYTIFDVQPWPWKLYVHESLLFIFCFWPCNTLSASQRSDVLDIDIVSRMFWLLNPTTIYVQTQSKKIIECGCIIVLNLHNQNNLKNKIWFLKTEDLHNQNNLKNKMWFFKTEVMYKTSFICHTSDNTHFFSHASAVSGSILFSFLVLSILCCFNIAATFLSSTTP